MVTVPPSVVKRTSPLVPTATVTGIVTTSPAVQRTFADVGLVAPVAYTYIELVVVPDKAVTDNCTDVALLGTDPTPATATSVVESAASERPRTVTGATDEYTDGVGVVVPLAKPIPATVAYAKPTPIPTTAARRHP